MALIDPNEPCPCGSGTKYAECHLPKTRGQNPPAITERCRLQVIPEPDPDARSVFCLTGTGTVIFQGFESGLAMDCGKCGAPLVAGLRREQIRGVVLKCNSCGAFNDT